MELTYSPIKKVETNFGLGYDGLLDSKSAVNSGTASPSVSPWNKNVTYWSNIKYSLTKDLLVGLEYQHFTTNWTTGGNDTSDNRVQTAVIYKF